MVSISVDKEPADIKITNFRSFFFFEVFEGSLDTAIHITIEIIATMVITFVDIYTPPQLISYFIYELRIIKVSLLNKPAPLLQYLLLQYQRYIQKIISERKR